MPDIFTRLFRCLSAFIPRSDDHRALEQQDYFFCPFDHFLREFCIVLPAGPPAPWSIKNYKNNCQPKHLFLRNSCPDGEYRRHEYQFAHPAPGTRR